MKGKEMQDLLQQEWAEHLFYCEDFNRPLGDGNFPSANEYIAAGVLPGQMESWYSVNGFDIDRMQELDRAGFSIDLLGASTEAGQGGYTDTIAYKFCNGDLSFQEVKDLIDF